MFTDKAKEKFEEWYNLQFKHDNKHYAIAYNMFVQLPLSMQWGVIEDFAESEEYNIQCYKEDTDWYIGIYYKGYVKWEDWVHIEKIKRNEARLECIKALNELLNK